MKKYKLQILLLSLILSMLVPLMAQASNEFSIVNNVFTETIKVEVNTVSGDLIAIQVIPDDADMEKLDDIEYMISSVVYADEKVADSSGKVSFEFPVKSSGEYIVQVNSWNEIGSEPSYKIISYSTLSDASSVWDSVLISPEECLPEILSILGVTDSVVLSMEDDGDLHKLINDYDYIGEFTKENADNFIARITSDCQNIINSRVVLSKIANVGNSSQIYSIITIPENAILLGVDEYLGRYKALKNTQIADMAVAGKTLSKEEFRTSFIKGIEDAEKAESESTIGQKPHNNTPTNVLGGGSLGGSVTVMPNNSQPGLASHPFVDVLDVAWATEAISSLYNEGIISGKSATEFAPGDYITREEFVKIAVGIMNIRPVLSGLSFADVDSSAWYAPYICAALDKRIINGYSDTVFGVGEFISRQDVAVILDRIYDVNTLNNEVKFSDYNDIADYARNSVDKLSSAGVIYGSNGCFMPDSNCTRAEAACMVYRIMSLMKGVK